MLTLIAAAALLAAAAAVAFVKKDPVALAAVAKQAEQQAAEVWRRYEERHDEPSKVEEKSPTSPRTQTPSNHEAVDALNVLRRRLLAVGFTEYDAIHDKLAAAVLREPIAVDPGAKR